MKEDLSVAIALHRNGQLSKAEKIYLNLLKENKNNVPILQLLGTIYLQIKNYELSEKYFLKCLEKEPKNPSALNNLGILKKNTNNIEKSIEYFEINIKKNNFLNSWINKSNILLENKKYTEGLEFSKEGLLKYPNNMKLRNNFGIFLFECGYQNEALNVYQQFDDEGIHFIDSYFNYSNILIKINNYSKSLSILNKLLLLDQKNLNALRQRAFIYKQFSDFKKAEEDLNLSIKIEDSNFLNNKSIVDLYIDTKEYLKAIPYCEKMIKKNVEKQFFLHKKILSKLHLGDWLSLKEDLEIFNNNLDFKNISLDPYALKYLNDDPDLQKKFSENYWQQKPKNYFLSKILLENSNEKKTSKIRIGYFSGDFTDHAVFQLIQDLFVNHNKSMFEIHAYSTFKKECIQRDKIIKYADKFVDLDQLSDEEIVKIVKSDNLDFAIDLSGYTAHNKCHLFEYDIAKIKINYLGFPGSMGTEKYNYIIADKNIIPEKHFNFYSEEVIYMPDIYQPFTPNIFSINAKKSDFDLPENSLILGCFSRIEKILPNIFDIWMNILKKYKDVYLALCIKKIEVIDNIKKYCDDNKFDFNRIIFLDPIEHKKNLERISTFDLYLDTFPYNGHTGISDSLYQSCVPTISLTGNSFASRVSLSLLNSLNLEELVTFDEKDYSKKIEYYCENRKELLKIKNYLIKYKKNNIDRMVKFTKDFENLILTIFSKNKKDNYNYKDA
jgi:predicted O-linked N-acetylglucosamine transferase (SPINDLY family)